MKGIVIVMCIVVGVYVLFGGATSDPKEYREAHRHDDSWDLPANTVSSLRHGQDGQRSTQQDESNRTHGWGG